MNAWMRATPGESFELASLLFHLGYHDGAREYLDHAESLPHDNGDLVAAIASLRHRLAQSDA